MLEMFMFLVIVIVLFYLISILSREIYLRKQLNRFPGPTRHVLLGNYFDISTDNTLEDVGKFFKKHGDVIYFNVGVNVLATTNKNLVEKILSDRINLRKPLQYRLMSAWVNNGLLTTPEITWEAQRKMITPAFHYSILESFFSVYNKGSDILMKKLRKVHDLQRVNVEPIFKLCTLDIICETAMGTYMDFQNGNNSEYVESVKDMCEVIVRRILNPLKVFNITYVFTGDFWLERKLTKKLHNFTENVIRKRQTDREQNNSKEDSRKSKKVFLDLLLDYSRDEKQLTMKEIRQEVDTFMFAGHDTTHSCLCFTTYLLSMHPEVQAKAFEEQNLIYGDEDRPVKLADLFEMPYLEAIIKESLRLYPPVPVYGRELTKDIFYDNKIIPAGTTALISAFHIQRNGEIYENPLKFNPERFLNGKTEKFAYVPFSGGIRNCIGMKFAIHEIKVIMSKLIRNFIILPTDPPHEVIQTVRIVMTSTNGFLVRLQPRF